MIKAVLIEDEKLLRKELSLTTPWNKLGCELLGEAENGLDGLELILRIKPHIIITDIRMPGMDGLTMIQKAQSKEYHPKVILLTGHSDFEYARKALRLGVIEYLLKPIDDSELYSLLKQTVQDVRSDIAHNSINENLEIQKNSSSSFFNPNSRTYLNGNCDNYVQQAVEYIQANFSNDIALQDTSHHLGISSGYLSHIFKKSTGYTFLGYITLFRIRHSLMLLKEQNLQVSDVAYKCGFQDPGYFIQLFRRHTGVTPGKYKTGITLTPGFKE